MKSPVAISEKYGNDFPVKGRVGNVEVPVPVDIHDRQPNAEAQRVKVCKVRECAVPVAKQNRGLRDIVAGDHQIRLTIVVELGHTHAVGVVAAAGRYLDRPLRLKGSVATAKQSRYGKQRSRGRADNHHIERPVVVQVCDVQAGRSRRGIESQLRLKRAVASSEQDRHVGRSMVRDHHIRDTVAVEVGNGYVPPKSG